MLSVGAHPPPQTEPRDKSEECHEPPLRPAFPASGPMLKVRFQLRTAWCLLLLPPAYYLPVLAC
jgi:hypothetical protein